MYNNFTEWVNNLSKSEINPSNTYANFHLANFLATQNSSVNPVVCNSRLVGTDAEKALNLDNQFINLKSNGQTSKAQELLGQSPATVLAMILSLTQQQCGFNPSDPTHAGNINDFLKYVNQLFQCPVLVNEINDKVDCSYGSDWGSSINSILGYYVGISPTDLNTIKDSLWNIARAASSCPNTSETQDLFVQNSLNIDGSYKIYMYKTFVKMVEEKHKGSGKNAPTRIKDCTSFTLYRAVFHLNCQDIASYSASLMSKTDSSLHSWLNDTSAPINSQAVKWTCEFV